MSTDATLDLRQVTVTFGSHTVLDGVDLRIAPGEAVGLVGPSGSGKSTIARVAAGLIRPSGGRAFFEGQPLRPAGPWSKGAVQAVLQQPDWSLNPRRTVDFSVTEPLALTGVRRAQRRTAGAAALEAVDLDARILRRYPHELSGGQRQRVAVARALIASPRLVVFDEVTSALDAAVQKQVLTLIARLRDERGFAALFISHDPGACALVADRVAAVHDGRIAPAPTPLEQP